MKNISALLFFAFAPFFSFGQCGVTTSHTDIYCYGFSTGTATASATGASPFSYLWSTSQTTSTINGLAAGTYTVTMTDNVGCIATATVTINTPQQLSQTMTSVAPSCGSCCDGSASVICSGGVSPYTYQWMPSGGTGATATGLCAGTYTCCMTDANGCSTCNNGCPFCQTSVTLSPLGQIEIVENNQIAVFPNPATNFVNVKETFANSVAGEISVYDVLGNVLLKRNVSGNEINENLDLSSFSKGVYFISVKTENGTSIEKFVKE